MNERARFNENGTPPDQRMPAQNSYYFPPASYPRGAQTPPQSHPQPQTFPQGYQEPAYQQGGYQQPGYRQPGYQQPVPPQPYYPQPQYPQPEPAAFATIDDAVAQISARQRALDGDSSARDATAATAAAGESWLRAGELMRRRNTAPRPVRRRFRPMPPQPIRKPRATFGHLRRPPRICRASRPICAISPPRSRRCASQHRISPAR